MKIISVVGARPNFMKVAPIHRAINKYNQQIQNSDLPADAGFKIHHLICHTGQHYDEKMSKVFFEDLELPKPDFYLGVGSGSHAEQTGKVMMKFEEVLFSEKPDLVLVVGDVNSTIACTLAAAKLHIKTVHVEAGLRSSDRSMPEEINRVMTDAISDYLFVTEKSGVENLKTEGVSPEKIFFVGHVMIDSVAYYLQKSKQSMALKDLGLESKKYVLVTLHRPSNVDNLDQLKKLVKLLNSIAERRQIVFPVHPRTKNNFEKFGILDQLHKNIILVDPVGYIDFLALINNSELILTDSGGIQEESTYLGVQCITLRDTTERPVTVDVGTNQLLGNDLEKAELAAHKVLDGSIKLGEIPELWDGHAAERIVDVLVR